MSETRRTETQLGVADLTKRLSATGIAIIGQHINPLPQRSIYFEIGNSERKTDITIPIAFLDNLPNTKEYRVLVDSYALAVAGRPKCGSPELFYCRAGVAIRVSIMWPIAPAWNASAYILFDAINQTDGRIARCSMEARHKCSIPSYEQLTACAWRSMTA